jgi:error-prone DNA polymerase
MFAHAQAGIAGIALFRQRPHTSKGVVFVTLEDETGIANLIIRPDIFDRYQRQIIASSCLLARGKLEYVGTALYVNTDQIESLDALITPSHSSPQAAAWAPPQGGLQRGPPPAGYAAEQSASPAQEAASASIHRNAMRSHTR